MVWNVTVSRDNSAVVAAAFVDRCHRKVTLAAFFINDRRTYILYIQRLVGHGQIQCVGSDE